MNVFSESDFETTVFVHRGRNSVSVPLDYFTDNKFGVNLYQDIESGDFLVVNPWENIKIPIRSLNTTTYDAPFRNLLKTDDSCVAGTAKREAASKLFCNLNYLGSFGFFPPKSGTHGTVWRFLTPSEIDEPDLDPGG